MKTRPCALWKKLLIAALILAVLCAAMAGGLSLWVWGQARGYLLSQEEAAALSDVDAILERAAAFPMWTPFWCWAAASGLTVPRR